MSADQAEGLRRRVRIMRVVSVFAHDDGTLARRIAQALQLTGLRVLRIDTRSAHAPQVRSLFGWREQLARGSFQPGHADGIDVFHAPGARAGEASMVAALRDYDALVFDCDGVSGASLSLDPATRQQLVVQLARQSLEAGYAVCKTLAQRQCACPIHLTGDAAACARLHAAVRRFLPQAAPTVALVPIDDAHLPALAARIAAVTSGADRIDSHTGVQHTHA